MQVERHQLGERQGQQPQIKDDARDGRHPHQDVDVSAVPILEPFPVVPEVMDRGALEEHSQKKAQVVHKVGVKGPHQDAAELAVRAGWEDAEVEEDDGGSDEEAGGRVDEHVGEKVLTRVSLATKTRSSPHTIMILVMFSWGVTR